MSSPSITIVVVSDYASTATRSWNDERRCLDALASQDFHEAMEILLVESDRFRNSVPPDIANRSNVKVVFDAASTSYGLKNAGARSASAPIVALLDADCRADPAWVRHCVNAFRTRDEIAVVSGRTFYDGEGIVERVLCLLGRSYQDPGHEGETDFASNNAVGFRRDVYLAHPLPEDLGPFSARVQTESIRRAGGILWFEPRMRVIHEFEGVPMERDIRKNIGYGTVVTRLAEPQMPYATLIRKGVAATPLIFAGKLFNAWRDCLRCSSAYGVRWFELPLALTAAVVVQALEIPGMISAYRGGDIGKTEYR